MSSDHKNPREKENDFVQVEEALSEHRRGPHLTEKVILRKYGISHMVYSPPVPEL